MRDVLHSTDSVRLRASFRLWKAVATRVARSRGAFLTAAVAAVLACLSAGAPAVHAAAFTCTWTDVNDDWTTLGDWSSCNATFPNNGGGNTYDVQIGNGGIPSLTTAVTAGSVSITSGGFSATGASAVGNFASVSNAGTFVVDNGASVTTTTGLSNTGSIGVDGSFVGSGGVGGSSLTLGGALTNNALATIDIGNPGMTASSTLRAASLSNMGAVRVDGTGAAAAGVLTLTGGLTNTGTVTVDSTFGGVGGSTAIVGGTLDNDTGTLSIGNGALSAPTTVTAGGLSNTGGSIGIAGGTTNQASLEVAAAAPSTSLGNISLSGDALLRFTGASSIQTIGSGASLSLNGPQAFVALSSLPTSNSALTGLSSNGGGLALLNGASVTTTGGLSNTGSIGVDGSFVGSGGVGGSSLTLGGALTNNALATIDIGNPGMTASSTLRAASLSNMGAVRVDGTGAAAAGVLTLTGGLTNTGTVTVDSTFGGVGGSTAIVGGTLDNDTGTLSIGNGALSAPTTVTAGGLSNTGGSIGIAGGTTNQASLEVAAAAPSTSLGNISLSGDALLRFTGASSIQTIGAGASLSLNGPQAFVALSSLPTSNSALTGLSSNGGGLALLNGASVTTTGGLSNTGSIGVDGSFVGSGGVGGSSLTLGGALTNNALATIDIGNPGMTASSTLRAASLSNMGAVRVDGTGAAAAGVLTLTGGLTNTGTVTVDSTFGGVGGSTAIVGGTLDNDTGTLSIGNGALSAPTTVTAGGLSNTGGSIGIAGGTTNQASLEVAAAAPSTSLGNISLSGDALLRFTGASSIQTIGAGASLSLNGPQAFVALSSLPTSNSALTGLSSNGGGLALLNGASVTTTGGLSNTGSIGVDGSFVGSGGVGGSSLTLGGALTNNALATIDIGNPGMTASSTLRAASLSNMGAVRVDGTGAAAAGVLTLTGGLTNTGTVTVDSTFGGVGGSTAIVGGTLDNDTGTLSIGNGALSAPTTVTAGGLSNTGGSIGIAGGTTNQASLEVAAAAPSTSLGNISLSGDALLRFTGASSIQTIGAGTALTLSGNQAFVALASNPTSNSALTGLSSNAGTFVVDNGASVTTTTGLSNTGSIGVDGSFVGSGGVGGSSLTLGGALTNNALATIDIGNPGMTASSTLRAASLSNMGAVRVDGTGAAAAGVLTLTGGLTNTGTVTVDSTFGGVGGSTAIVGGTLDNDTGTLSIGNGALSAPTTVTAGGLSNTGGSIGIAGGTTNQASLEVAAAAPSTSLGNISLSGDALLRFTGASSIQTIGAGASLSLNGPQAFVALSSLPTSNSALTGLSSNGGGLALLNGASVTTTGGLSNTGSIGVDGSFVGSGGVGGSSLTLGGALTNNALATIDIGNPGMTASSTLRAASLSNMGAVRVDGTGAAAAGVLTLTGGLTNTGTVTVDSTFGGVGGSTAIVGGTLDNDTGTLSIGNGALSAPTTVTAGGLSNTGGSIGLVGGSATNVASLTVNGAASNAGTVGIGQFSNLTVTGAGNAYAQTAGTTTVSSSGALAAPSVNVSGGTLQGNGTVTGTVNVSGTATVEAFNPSTGNADTLTVNGAYNQSGGTLAALLQGTGAGQVGTVAVAGGNALRLSGGNLASAPGSIGYAAGQTFSDVVTFQPGQLFGTFGQLQGGGNGTNVSLGGGLVLEASYNNAAGNISLQVVGNPTTGFIWNDGTGNWDTATDWTANAVPTPVADVTIGNTATGNVTLTHDSTINSLTINTGNALSTTAGTLTVGTNVVDSGSLTLGGSLNLLGTVTVNGGASLGLSGGTIIDATLAGPGTIQTNPGGSGTLNGVTISGGTTFAGRAGSSTTLLGTITNNGTIDAAGGSINATTGFNGTGTARIDPGGTLTIGANSAVGTLTHNGTTAGSLALGTQNITVSQDYTNASFGVGNAFNNHANVTGTGQILAAGDVGMTVTGTGISGGGSPTLALGNVHVGANNNGTFDINNTGTNGPVLRGAVQNTGINNPAFTVTAQNFGPLALGASQAESYNFNPAAAGALNGQSFKVVSNFDNVAPVTVGVSGAAFRLAAPTVAPNPVVFGNVHVGGADSQALTVTNTAANDGFSEKLDASIGGATGAVTTSGGPISLLAPQASSTALSVGLNTANAGHQSGTATVTLTSNGAGTSGLGTTALPSATVNVSGNVYRLAQSNVIAPINFGVLHTGAGIVNETVSISNLAAADGFSEGLDSSFGNYANSGGSLTPTFAGSITNLAAGATDNASLVASLNTAVAGSVNGNITVHQASNGATTSGLGITALPDQTPGVTGTVQATVTNLAQPQINNAPISFGNVHVGANVGTQGVSVTNAAPNSGFSESLIGAATGTTGTGITATGGFGPPSLNPEVAPQGTDSTSIQVGIDTSAAGAKSGNAVIDFKSDGTAFGGTITDLGNTNVAVSGNVYRLAAPTVSPNPVNFANAHVGDALAQALSVANTAANDGFSEKLDAAIGGATGAVTTSGGPISLLAPQASSTALSVGLSTANAGHQSGTATVALTSNGAGTSGLGTTALPSATVNVSGNVYRLAAATVSPNPINFANAHVGDALSQALTIANTAANDGFSEKLDAAIGGATGAVTTSGGPISLLAPQASSTALSVGLSTANAGHQSGTATVTLTSNGAGTSGLGTTALPSATVNVSGNVYRLAQSNVIAPINFGVLHVGAGIVNETVSVSNLAAADGFSEGLDSSFGNYANSGGSLTPTFAGSITNLAAGATDNASLVASLNTAVAGTVNGNVTIHQNSNGATTSGLGITALADQNPGVTGTVQATVTNLAKPQINNAPISFGNVHVGAVVGTQGVSVTNAAPVSAFTEGLIGNVTGTTGTGITASGGFGPPTANPELGGQQTDATHIRAGIDTSTAGAKSGNAQIDFKSDGTPFGGVVTDLGNTNVAVSGNVYRLAQSNVIAPINFGVLHVGAGIVNETVSISNLAAADGFSEGLDSSFGNYANSGGSLTPTFAGSITNLAAGATDNASLVASLNTAVAGTVNGNVTIHQNSNGATTSGLGITALADQNPGVTGTVQAVITNLAQPQINNAPISFGNVRIGTVLGTQGVSVTNAAPASAFTEGLIGNATGTTGTGITASGGFGPPSLNPELGGQQTDATSIQVGIDTSAAGAKAGNAVIDFKSDGTPFGGTITDLGNTNVAVSGNVYRLANPTLNTPSATLAARVGDASPSAAISVTNTSPDAFTEGLKASLGAAPAGFTASGAIANLAAGATDNASLNVGLSTATSGTFNGSQGVNFTSTGAGTDNAPDLALPGGSVALTGKVYATAVASVAPNPVNFGIVHVGDVVAGQALTLGNTASGALTDVLTGGFGTVSGPFSGTGALAGVAAGSSDSTSLKVGLNTATAGVFNGTADLALKSHDADLADVAVAAGPVMLNAQVNNFANAAFLKQSGNGAFSGGALSYVLNFGNVVKGSGALSAVLGVANDVAGPADLLAGTFSLPGGGFGLSGFDPFAGLAAGDSIGGLDVLLDPIDAGVIEEFVTLMSTGSNASGFSGALPDVTLELVANVTGGGNVPEPAGLAVLAMALAGLAGIRRR